MPSRTGNLFESSRPTPVPPALAAVPAVPPQMPQPATRELWLCLYLPDLPLEALAAKHGPAADTAHRAPLCVTAGDGTRQAVVAANAAARRRGVLPGLGPDAALALVPDLTVWRRQPAAEAVLLGHVARWSTQFTPFVSLEPPDAVLAEVRGSLGLFGGAAALRGRAERELHESGLRAVAAIAPTPRAALWLVRSGLGLCVESVDGLPSLAARLPLACLGWPPTTVRTLSGMGARAVADLARLPRDGFAQRFGPALLAELDAGFGRRREPRRRALVPERFDGSVELPQESGSCGLVEAALGHLLERLQDFLRARAAGISGLAVEFRHRTGPATRLRVGLARPGNDAGHLLALLRERLARTPLPAPAVALHLRSTVVLPLRLQGRALFDEAGGNGNPEDAARLLERLRARLGEEAVFSVRPVPEHRPERAWCIAEPLSGADCRERGGRGPRSERLSAERAERDPAGSRSPQPAWQAPRARQQPVALERPRAPRPLWMLRVPQRLRERGGLPLYEGRPLGLEGGPERIESGWWDGCDVRRDYHAARTPGGVRLWVYRERNPGSGWWLHGVFG